MVKTNESLDAIFRPQAIAVIGASNKPNNIGREIVHNLIEFEFQGPVFPVNPHLRTLHSLKVYPSVEDVPDPVDLAVIVVPKEHVLTVVESCGRKGVKGLVVITAGFKEVGGPGTEREAELARLIHKYSMRMVGPNCMGVINTEPDIRLDASFARTLPSAGNIGFMSQSGALGEAILSIAHKKGIGFSMFVSVGNKTDVSGNDLLRYWEHDPATKLILLYLESFGDPREFTSIARRISRTKPIIAVKAGRTTAGAKAVSSHTGALAGRDMATDLMFEQCGVIRASSVEDLFDLAPAFSRLDPPEGPRVGIITNAGGPGILTTDACVACGLVIEPPSPETRAALRGVLSPDASVENPVDLLASATPDQYRESIRQMLLDPLVDALIVIFVPPVMTRSDEVARAICEQRTQSSKPILVCFMGADEGVPGVTEMRSQGIPVYTFPESAAHALAALVSYRQWQKRPEGRPVEFQVDRSRAARFLELNEHFEGWLDGPAARGVLESYGIPFVPSISVRSPAELDQALENIGFPAVLKADGSGGEHKTDSGGVILNLQNRAQIIEAYRQLSARGTPVLLQPMLQGGQELILGMSMDAVAGPLMMFGFGGVQVEVIRDVVFRIHPLKDIDAREMVRSVRSLPLLEGYRGEKGISLEGIEEALLRLSRLVSDFSEIEEIDINPFMAFPGKPAMAIDARIRVRKAKKFPVETVSTSTVAG